jgi:hypothetical protein
VLESASADISLAAVEDMIKLALDLDEAIQCLDIGVGSVNHHGIKHNEDSDYTGAPGTKAHSRIRYNERNESC